MVKIDTFYIDFDQQWSVYSPGETVSGTVTIRSAEKIYADEVVAQFTGQGRVFWIEKELNPPLGLQNKAYSKELTFFEGKESLWSPKGHKGGNTKDLEAKKEEIDRIIKESGSYGIKTTATHPTKDNKNRFLQPGTHSFAFHFTIPGNPPTSYESSAAPGWIRYSVRICVMEESRVKHHRKEFFTLIRPFDLAQVPHATQPVVKHIDAPILTNAGLCCMSGNGSLGLLVSLQKSGFVPGERILLTAELDNQSGSSRVEVKLRLRIEQRVSSYASEPELRMRETVATLATAASTQDVRRGTAWMWDPHLFVPALVPSFAETDLMEVTYVLVVEAFAGKSRPVVQVGLPVYIGTVPVESGPYRDTSAPVLKRRHSPPADHEMAPPSYEESVMGRERSPDSEFLPQYPVFHVNARSPAINDTANLVH